MGNKQGSDRGSINGEVPQPPEVDTKRLSTDRPLSDNRRRTLMQNRSSVRKSIAFSHSIFSQDGEDAKIMVTTHCTYFCRFTYIQSLMQSIG